jgi:small-conductance mechanosensitive channel
MAIESMTDIDAAVKTDNMKYIDQAIAYLEAAADTDIKTRELSQLIQTAPERLKILQAELKKPFWRKIMQIIKPGSKHSKRNVEMSEIDEQTRTLLKLFLFILALAGLWAIWEPVFPTLGILQDIQFWSYSTVMDGVTKTVPITLVNIIMAVFVAVTTIIAGRLINLVAFG